MIQAFALVLATSFAAPSPQLTAGLQPGYAYKHLCHAPESTCSHRFSGPAAVNGVPATAKKVRTIRIRVRGPS